MNVKFVILLAGSGGVGKSWLARQVAQAFGAAKTPLEMYDCDEAGNRDFQKFFGPEDVRHIDIGDQATFIALAESLMKGRAELVLADLKASCLSAVASVITPKMVDRLRKREGVQFVIVTPVTNKQSSFTTVLEWVRAFGPAAHYVVVKNERDGEVFLGTNVDFAAWYARHSPLTLTLPPVDRDVAMALDAKNALLTDAIDAANDEPNARTDLGFELTNSITIGGIEEAHEAFTAEFAKLRQYLQQVQAQAVQTAAQLAKTPKAAAA